MFVNATVLARENHIGSDFNVLNNCTAVLKKMGF